MNPRIINYIRWIVINATQRPSLCETCRQERTACLDQLCVLLDPNPFRRRRRPTDPTNHPSSGREIPFVVCNCCAHRLPENVTGILIFNRHSAFVRRGDYDCPFVAVHVSFLLLLLLLLLLGSICPSLARPRVDSVPFTCLRMTGNEMERN